MRRWTCAALIVCSWPAVAAAEDISVAVTDPRPFGYFLGDVLIRQIDIVTRGQAQFRASALPRPGPQLYWLDLVDVSTEKLPASEGQGHRVRLKYQMFYSALEPKRVTIPKTTLYFTGTEKAAAAEQPQGAVDDASNTRSVPELEVIVSPLREIIVEKSADTDESPLRADATARPAGTGALRTGWLASGTALALALLGLAHHYAIWPFAARPRRPFTQAVRALGDGDEGDVDAAYQRDLQTLHRAFDAAFGRRVFARDVPAFLVERSEFRTLEPQVREFFEASSIAFFAADKDAARARLSRSDVDRLARDLARLERGAA